MNLKGLGDNVEIFPTKDKISANEETSRLDTETKLLIAAGYQKLLSIKIEEPYSQDYLDEDQFRNVKGYTEKEVEESKSYVRNFENEFDKKRTSDGREIKKKSDILEYIIFEQGERGNWFGILAHTIKTCKFDDIKNGVDLVLETQEDPGEDSDESVEKKLSYLGLAADITFERMDNAIGIGKEIPDKFERIKKEIEDGKLAEVKFFKSRLSEPKSLINIPRVVLNIDSKMANELIELWVNNKNEELAKHKIHIIIVHQIVAQLAVYEKYAKLLKKKEIAKILKQVYEEFEEVRLQKRKEFSQYAKSLDLDVMKEGYEAILKI